MGLDEVGTARTLREHRKVTDALVAKHGGRLVKATGDGVLLEFPSVVDAVECSVAVQAVMAQRNEGIPADRRMLFRIGINLGDILIEGDDILGDGVNIAARLEGIAEPGGICLSASAYDQVRGKVAVEFTDLGELTLKNIARSVHVYAVRSAHQFAAPAPPSHSTEQQVLSLPDKPSIAVLPFQNMSGDPEQEYFADGMVEDIITSLSRLKSLLVIARNSSFTYKGKVVDIKQVGRELGVRYILEGSVRRGGNRLRITGQLIETSTGSHLWADRWDCGLADIFDAQDEITARIQNAISGVLNKNEARQVSRAGRNIQAWQLRIQAWEGFYRWDREALLRGLERAREAVRLEPQESDGYAAAGSCLYSLALSGWTTAPGLEAMTEAVMLLTRAVNLEPENAMACTMLGVCLLAVGRPDEAVSQVTRGSELAPGSYYSAVGSGIVLGYCGQPLEALDFFDTAIRVSPRDPRIYATYQAKCAPLFALDRYEDVVSAAQRVMRLLPEWPEALTMQAAALVRLGRVPEARRVVESLRKLDERYSVKRALGRHPYRKVADRDKLGNALIVAGLS
jgi:adenylate cyclase